MSNRGLKWVRWCRLSWEWTYMLEEQKEGKSQAFCIYCFQCCVIISSLIEKKECKGLESAMNITGSIHMSGQIPMCFL